MHSTLKLSVRSSVRDYFVEFTSEISDITKITEDDKVIPIIDSNVAKLYPQLNINNPVIVDCIEDNKNLAGVNKIFDLLVERKANIKTSLLVIGGGILQDMCGFCASTYCRGIDYTLIPTTLLAQADSCVGGKTSLNHSSRKNILGTFYPPSKIIVFPKFTETLSKLDYISGLGELYKFYILQNKINLFDSKNDILTMIHDGLKYKINIIEEDEFDKGTRKFLNFGHTFGHAIESLSSYKVPHGIAVIIGSMIALQVSKNLGYKNKNYKDIIEIGKNLLLKNNIETNQSWFDFKNLLPIVLADKKSTGKLTMILLNEEKPLITEIENYVAVQKALEEVYASF